MTITTIFEELVAGVRSSQRAQFRSHYRAVTRLPETDRALQPFLDEYLEHLVHLYAATAGAIWFRKPDGEGTARAASPAMLHPGGALPPPGQLAAGLASKARIGFDQLGLNGELAEAHARLLQFALGKSKSFLVKPYSAPEKHAAVSNPTDSFIVLGPVDHHGERIAVVELFLGPTPARGRTAAERNRYLLWLDHLLSYFCRGVELRLLRSAAPLPPALDQLAVAGKAAAAVQATIRSTLEQHLAHFSGWNFGSLEGNHAFTARVQELLDQFGFRVVCPQCGSPAILRCQNSGNAKSGVFLYDHTLEQGRTFHGGPTSFPKVELVPRPARRRRVTGKG
jgi:hypothetical protein